MPRKLTNPETIHPAPGFSHIAESSGSQIVHFAGQTALDTEFGVVGDDLYAQTMAAMRNLKLAMDAVNVCWGDITRRTIYTLHPTEFETISKAIDEVTGGAENPAQTIVGITGLAVPGLMIEIECTAVTDGDA